MEEELRMCLERYVRARNGRRSAVRAAEGFVSGKRIYALKVALKEESQALSAIADWAEEMAREALETGSP